MKIKELEEALRTGYVASDDKQVELIEEAAQTMLELMKAREKATGGEWKASRGTERTTVFVDTVQSKGHLTQICEVVGNVEQRRDFNQPFITLAANLTREGE